MAAALEDIRARIDRGLGRAPANAPAEVPTLDSLKARIDRAFGRESREPVADPPKPARRVPRTPAALNNLLDEWDRLRNARGVSPERKAEAKRLQQDAINRLEGVKHQVQQAEHEGRAVEGANRIPPAHRQRRRDHIPARTRR